MTLPPNGAQIHPLSCLVETHLQGQLLNLKLLRGMAVPICIFMVVDHHHVILLHDGFVVLGIEVVHAVFAIVLGDLQALLPPGQGPQGEEDTQKHPAPLHGFRCLVVATPPLQRAFTDELLVGGVEGEKTYNTESSMLSTSYPHRLEKSRSDSEALPFKKELHVGMPTPLAERGGVAL